jgi:hypothetical protein
VRYWIPKVRENPIAKVLRNHSANGCDLLRATGMECCDDVTLFFGIKARGKRARPNHVAKHDGQLAAFGD